MTAKPTGPSPSPSKHCRAGSHASQWLWKHQSTTHELRKYRAIASGNVSCARETVSGALTGFQTPATQHPYFRKPVAQFFSCEDVLNNLLAASQTSLSDQSPSLIASPFWNTTSEYTCLGQSHFHRSCTKDDCTWNFKLKPCILLINQTPQSSYQLPR